MNLLEDPDVKSRYQKYKYKIKKWENDFIEKYARPPKKSDIHKADASIKDAYKKYWNLKIQALDETLLDITFEDEVNANVSANISCNDINISIADNTSSLRLDESRANDFDASISTSVDNSLERLVKNVENIEPKKSPVKEFPAVVDEKIDTKNVEGAWGNHLNKDADIPKSKNTRLVGGKSSPMFQLSQKKFNSASFTKRNPRKSLSMNKTKSKTNVNSASTSTLDSKIDKNEEDFVKSVYSDTVKIVESEKNNIGHSVNTISRLMNSEKSLNLDRKYDAGWLERCARENNFEQIVSNTKRLSGTSDSGIDIMDSSVSPPAFNHSISSDKVDNTKNLNDDDDDEYVCNSDSEEEHRKKRSRNWRKTLSDNQPKRFCPENRVPVEISTGLTQVPISTEENVEMNQEKNHQVGEKSLIVEKNDLIVEKNDKVVEKNDKIVEENKVKTKIVENETKKQEEKIIIESKEEEEEEEEEEKSRKKKSTTRSAKTDGAVRKKPTVTARKTRATLKSVGKRTTRSTRKKKYSDDNDEEEDKVDDKEKLDKPGKPEIPIYGIESFDVVPRFAVPRDTNGDLVSEFSKTVETTGSATSKKIERKKISAMSDKEKLEAKVAAGKINENFVRINLKKKIYSRGKKSFNFSRYKKGQWKQRKKDLASSEGALDLADLAEKNTCFKCGGSGHVSRSCPAMKSDELLPLTEDDPSDFPTLEEAEKMANQEARVAHSHRPDKLPSCPSMSIKKPTTIDENKESPTDEDLEDFDDNDFDFDDQDFDEITEEIPSKTTGHKIPADLLAKLLPPMNGNIDPLYQPEPTGQLIKTPKEVIDTLKMFGHKNFRPGQEKAMMRILSGQSTLVTLSTGSGKSLCYQLPAYLYSRRSHCITLVVSPLVSLMDDQVTGVPNFLRAAALHTGQTPKVREKIMETVRTGDLDILLVSPEAIVAGEKSSGFGALLRQLPPIAFACIDEAHCISQWSHNFRPSYLMICRVLIEKMGVKTILGLTATATKSTAKSIVEHLKIPDGLAGVISDIPMPNNLMLTVSKDDQRDRALIELLQSERFNKCDSIIIYCTRREECTRIAGLLRVSLQSTIDPDKPKPKAKVSQISEAYHAGLASSRRKVIQKAFMKGDTRIVVATVAFGMGINKSDIRSVIHYNMPSNFEGYVQEVGRAGRDNLPAHCHLFLSPIEDSDKWELRRHIYADGVDRHSIRRLLQKIFIPCSCKIKCPGHEVAISIDETVKTLDVTEETISTLLCYLELHPRKLVTVLSSVYITAKVSSYAGPKGLKNAAQISPPLAMAIALDSKKGITHDNDSFIEFPVVDVAAAIGWDSGVVKSHLKNLEWTMVDGKSKRSAISVKYETLGLRVRAPGDLNDTELDEALEALYERTQSQQDSGLKQLEAIHAALNKFSYNSVKDCVKLSNDNLEKSEFLKDIIREYFQSDKPLSVVDVVSAKSCNYNEAQIVADVRSLICSYRDNNFTGRAVARIFHGIQSPNYSALTWCRCRYWRAHIKHDFNSICQIATREILAMR